MIKFFRLSIQAEAFRKGFVNLFSVQARLPRWAKQNQMSGKVLMQMGMDEIAACGPNKTNTTIYD
jgi:hypothetical protein